MYIGDGISAERGEHTTVSLDCCGALLCGLGALLSVCRALLSVCRALLSVCRALLSVCRALLSVYGHVGEYVGFL